MGSRLSNGTMGHLWMDRWCFRCVHDHGMSHTPDSDPDKGCEVVLRLMMDDPTPELIDHDEMNDRGWTPDSLECRLFERCPCRDDPGWEPTPPPIPDPNQGLLFEVIDETPGVPMAVIPTAGDLIAPGGAGENGEHP